MNIHNIGNMRPMVVILSLMIGSHSLLAQGLWMWNQRTHPELTWETIETEHFNIHFHQGIEGIARKGAAVAEQVYQPIMDQLQLADFGKTDIVLSAEDEIMNGFAMPSDQIFIWISQNDVAGRFGGSEKWLKQVIAHEFQHVAQFRAMRTWLGALGAVSIPGWWLEGMAEYMTEVWRVDRSDAQMKIHTYKNTLQELDPHDDGYAKVLYLAWKYGDSTLVKISAQRLYLDPKNQHYPVWYDFKTAFERTTGQTLQSFNEEWRRVMNSYYYGYKVQKESVDEVGEPFPIKGFASVRGACIAEDAKRIVVVGKRDRRMQDEGLYLLSADSNGAIEEVHFGRFSGDPTCSPDGAQFVISEYHRGKHGSLIYDLRLIDLNTHRKQWLTRDLRTHHPVFSKDGKGVFFVAHPGETSQIHYLNLASTRRVQVSNFSGDVQVRDLDLSCDGRTLAFAIQEENGAVNIAVMDIDGRHYHKITDDPQEDILPVWSQTGDAIVFTSYRNGTPNLYRVDLDSLIIQPMTDVAEGLFSHQRMPGSNRILATTLTDVDTVRVRLVPVDRKAPELTATIRTPYAAWRQKTPDIPIPKVKLDASLITVESRPYEARKTMRPLARFIWPDVEGLFGMAIYTDALSKHLIQGATVLGYDGSLKGGYLSYLNLQFRPSIHVFASKDLAFNLHHSFDHLYVEMRNGAGVALEFPMNRGSSLSSNHEVRVSVQGLQRDLYTSAADLGDLLETSDISASSSEMNLGITYMWKTQRPRKDQYFLPRDGSGFLVHAESTAPALYGDNDYSQLWIEGFTNWSIPGTSLTLFTRLKGISQQGSILDQDVIGFSETAGIYLSNAYWNTLRGTGLFDTPESYSLRGQTGDFTGKELIYSVNEMRLPLLTQFPMNLLGFGFQNLTAAAFYDFGYLPETAIQLSTFGAEIKFDLSFMKFSLLTLALGYGGDTDYWKQNSTDLDPYLRLALVNPF